MNAALDIKGSPIHKTKEHHFLEVAVDERSTGVAHVKFIIAAIIDPARAGGYVARGGEARPRNSFSATVPL